MKITVSVAKLVNLILKSAHLLHHAGAVCGTRNHVVILDVKLCKLVVQHFKSPLSGQTPCDSNHANGNKFSFSHVDIHTAVASNLQ